MNLTSILLLCWICNLFIKKHDRCDCQTLRFFSRSQNPISIQVRIIVKLGWHYKTIEKISITFQWKSFFPFHGRLLMIFFYFKKNWIFNVSDLIFGLKFRFGVWCVHILVVKWLYWNNFHFLVAFVSPIKEHVFFGPISV